MPLNGLFPPFLTTTDPNFVTNIVNGEITLIGNCAGALSGNTNIVLVADVGGQITIKGVQQIIADTATAMRVRLVTRSNKDVTDWVDIFDGTEGNDWNSNDITAIFTAQDLSRAPDAHQYRLTIEIITPTTTYGFSSRDVVSIDHPC